MASMSNTSGLELEFTSFFNVVDGELCKAYSNKFRSTLNPATLNQNPEVPFSSAEDVDRAVDAARKAAKSWATLPWKVRQEAVAKFADALEANSNGFAQTLVQEQGKTIHEARGELYLTVQYLRGTASLTLPGDELIDNNEQRKAVRRYTPLGVAVGIVPWNYPVYLACQRVGQALITGNPIILKPSPFAPYCNLKLAELGLRFFPPGVFQALSGEADLGSILTAHPSVDLITFAGSVATGKKVMEACSKTLKRMVLELGGNDPAIVMPDVDIATIAPTIAYLAFANSGQICTLPKRVYVHESIYDNFLSGMVNYAKNLKLRTDEAVAIGPVSNKAQYDSVKSLLADTETRNLSIAAGSTKPPPNLGGYYLMPTLVDNPPDDARVVVEEPFGPILPVLKWSNEEEVIQRANDTNYGLGASVWSKDITNAERIARQLQAGCVWINTHAELDAKFPFGGYKQSGIGAEGGLEGLKGYCNVQVIWSKLG
ncbi:aldehyde dehydrogenase-like protein [Xylaria venustula]|nr:aldehyde dehydrogenase-like protein [Xylaria venustula]